MNRHGGRGHTWIEYCETHGEWQFPEDILKIGLMPQVKTGDEKKLNQKIFGVFVLHLPSTYLQSMEGRVFPKSAKFPDLKLLTKVVSNSYPTRHAKDN